MRALRRSLRLAAPAAALLLLTAVPGWGGDHLRVVLDTSGSMETNDPGHLAILATVLLYDLAALEVEQDDSFKVLPFDPAWTSGTWSDPQAPPPSRLSFRPGADRLQFVNRFRSRYASGYDGQQTYYYPGVAASVAELERSPGDAQEIRHIVLITDGVPIHLDWERDLFSRDLVPRMIAAGIRFDILAVGTEATDQSAVMESLLQGPEGPIGQVFPDRDGKQMLETMIKIFSNSFGYVPAAVTGQIAFDLENDQAPDRVAVVAYSTSPSPPVISLTAPPGASVNTRSFPLEGREMGGSYSLQWVLRPEAGDYRLDNPVSGLGAPPFQLAVLRPARLEIEVLPPGETHWALVGTERRIRVLVKPPAGHPGDPGRVDLAFRTVGRRRADPATGEPDFAWRGHNWLPPVDNKGTVVPEGRVFELPVTFAHEVETGADSYLGHLEIEVRRRRAVVAALTGADAHPITVYGALALQPAPPRADAVLAGGATTVLGRQQVGCADFALDLAKGQLPHRDDPRYTVRARLGPKVALAGPFHGARFTLDGLPLDPADASGSEWSRGRELQDHELFDAHQACVELDRPMAGDDHKPFEVPIVLTLIETPYDEAEAIAPFVLRVRVPPPSFIDKWGSATLIGLYVLALIASGFYLYGRPVLPGDLQVAIGHLDAAAGLTPRPLGSSSHLRRWLGLVEARPLHADGDQTPLGWIRPVRDELHELRLARGVEIDTEPPGGKIRRRGRKVRLAAHRTYRLQAPRTTYLVRMEYR